MENKTHEGGMSFRGNKCKIYWIWSSWSSNGNHTVSVNECLKNPDLEGGRLNDLMGHFHFVIQWFFIFMLFGATAPPATHWWKQKDVSNIPSIFSISKSLENGNVLTTCSPSIMAGGTFKKCLFKKLAVIMHWNSCIYRVRQETWWLDTFNKIITVSMGRQVAKMVFWVLGTCKIRNAGQSQYKCALKFCDNITGSGKIWK